MHIPYMRITIYCLTFLTYCYSGYGANILGNLRDAIISSEIIFGDIFKNLITVFNKFKIVNEVFDAAVDENCIYKCQSGSPPVRNRFYIPKSDGCGSLGIKINKDYLPAIEMEKCCDEHDICYDSCNNDKELCDLDFKRCLYKYCETHVKSPLGEIILKGCKAASKVLFTGTITLGCKSYLESQKRSCYCATSSSNSDSKNYNKKNFKDKGGKDENHKQYGWKDFKDL